MADGIKIGNLDISTFKVGSDDCKIYLGDTLLYPNEKYSFGFYRQLRDGSEYTVSCSSSADTITSAQTRSGLTNAQITGSTQNAKNPVLVIFGDCCSTIGYGACISWKWLSSVTISNGVTSIDNYAFQICSRLTRLNSDVDGVFNIPNGVTSIGNGAFQDCSGLTSIDIPDSVTSIGRYVFAYCYSLSSCTIGSGVTSIGAYAFGSCSSLTSITVNATTPPTLADTNSFANTNNCPIYVPASSVNSYKSTTNWSTYASRIQAIPS